MTTIQVKEHISNGFTSSDVIQNQSLDLSHFAEACGQSPEWVMQLIEHGILPERTEPQLSMFRDEDISRAQRAYRLQRDFDASFSAVAMMIDLIDEVQQLRHQVKHPNFKSQ